IYYATQVSTNPPTIVLFTNSPDLFDNTYHRYLMKEIRDRLGAFRDIPIKLHLRRKSREDDGTALDEGDTASIPPEEQPTPKRPRRDTKKKRRPISRLKFKTKLEDADRDRDQQSELWTDL